MVNSLRIDIDRLSEAEQIDLNRRIVPPSGPVAP
jgi:hypothetical protein